MDNEENKIAPYELSRRTHLMEVKPTKIIFRPCDASPEKLRTILDSCNLKNAMKETNQIIKDNLPDDETNTVEFWEYAKNQSLEKNFGITASYDDKDTRPFLHKDFIVFNSLVAGWIVCFSALVYIISRVG